MCVSAPSLPAPLSFPGFCRNLSSGLGALVWQKQRPLPTLQEADKATGHGQCSYLVPQKQRWGRQRGCDNFSGSEVILISPQMGGR